MLFGFRQMAVFGMVLALAQRDNSVTPPTDGVASQADAPPGDLLLVVQVGETAGGRTVSADLLERLVQATKQPALEALDRYFGTDAWCPKITTTCSVEGPIAYFSLYLAIQPGETQASTTALVDGEFRRRWSAAAQRLLASR